MANIIDVEQMSVPFKLIDTRFELSNPQTGRTLYDQGHIEHAMYWDLNEDLSDMTLASGRHPMPSKKQLQTLFERSGLYVDDVIYIYDQGAAAYAFRAWFLLKYAGFKNVMVVNGGMEALINAGYHVTTEVPTIHPSKLSLHFEEERIVTKEHVKEIVHQKVQAQLLDARSYERYVGKHEPIDTIAGHIPSAMHFDWEQLVNGGKIVEELGKLDELSKDQRYVVYCGSGVSAIPVYAALLANDFSNVQLYAGSYSDWITSEEVATGDEMKK